MLTFYDTPSTTSYPPDVKAAISTHVTIKARSSSLSLDSSASSDTSTWSRSEKTARSISPARSVISLSGTSHDDGLDAPRQPRRPTAADKSREAVSFAKASLYAWKRDNKKRYSGLSANGRFAHYVLNPLSEWFGQNERVLGSPALCHVDLKNSTLQQQSLINAASVNYVGAYGLSKEYEALHQRCLETLPYADETAVSSVHKAMLTAIADFFSADCCFSTTTGYQSNILAMTAIVEDDWLVVLDDKCHDSIFTGSYLSSAAARKRFKHGDMKDLKAILEAASGSYTQILVGVEGLYSMDGTFPNLQALAKLKQKYGFVLYCDEAHSFLSVGRTGRGCQELWNDNKAEGPVATDIIDIRTGTLSKSVGANGGFVCASRCFKERLRMKSLELRERGESLSTTAMLQTLWILRQPCRIERNLERLRSISLFCHQELRRAGVFVYGEDDAPMLPVHAGRPTLAAALSYTLRELGVLATAVSKPSVDKWESRVRIVLSASLTDDDVNQLIKAIVEACNRLKIIKRGRGSPRHFQSAEVFFDLAQPNESALKTESEDALRSLKKLIDDQAYLNTSQLDRSVISAGHVARARYGLASGSSRMVAGTFVPHLEVETLCAKLTHQPAALTYPETDTGMMSTIAALCRPITNCSAHYLLVPRGAGVSVRNGFRAAAMSANTVRRDYADVNNLPATIKRLAGTKNHITLYLDSVDASGAHIDLEALALSLAKVRSSIGGLTVLLDDRAGFQRYQRDLADGASLDNIKTLLGAQILVFGSFYDSFGLNGAYLAGDDATIEEFRWFSRCYMFSASPSPCNMAMVAAALRARQDSCEQVRRRHGRLPHVLCFEGVPYNQVPTS